MGSRAGSAGQRGPSAGGLDPDELRTFAAVRLPSYMVPDRLVIVERLPLGRNGKVDRRALLQLVAQEQAEEADRDSPQGPAETGMAAVWQEVLGVATVGRHSNFFALGGDSLLATHLVETASRRFGIRLTLRQLFASPTVAQLAGFVASQQVGESGELEEGVV